VLGSRVKELMSRIADIFSIGLLIASLSAFFVYGNYIKTHRPYIESMKFKFSYYGMGRPIYLSGRDYVILLIIWLGILCGILTLYYRYRRRKV